MKKRIYYITFLFIIMSVTVLNTVTSLQSNNKLSALTFSLLDAIAGAENDPLTPGESIVPGTDMQLVKSFDCAFSKDVVIGLDDNDRPIITTVSVLGKIGICNGDSGPCEKYSCTESWM